jgi:hypothetical protein
MKLSKTIDQTRICKKSYDDPLGYFCMGLFCLLSLNLRRLRKKRLTMKKKKEKTK